jgi:hypothetical protein
MQTIVMLWIMRLPIDSTDSCYIVPLIIDYLENILISTFRINRLAAWPVFGPISQVDANGVDRRLVGSYLCSTPFSHLFALYGN